MTSTKPKAVEDPEVVEAPAVAEVVRPGSTLASRAAARLAAEAKRIGAGENKAVAAPGAVSSPVSSKSLRGG